jgi:putative glutamine amidotransferase
MELRLKPIIGISAGKSFNNNQISQINLIENYFFAIKKAGGIPLIIPTGLSELDLEQIIHNFDGIVISGGGDIETSRYQGRPDSRVSNVDPNRDNLEINLEKLTYKNQIPLLGICRGCQVINVAFGGSLYSDIASQYQTTIRHDCFPGIARDHEAHSIEVQGNSHLEIVLSGNKLNVNSLHHQGIKLLGDNLLATAYAPDGIIEAIEIKNHPFLIGVQWHPEWMLSSPPMQNLFNEFINSTRG